jgi:hypothetical protein
MSYRVIRASEIVSYVYCHRAWWLHQEERQPGNISQFIPGTEYHRDHHRQVMRSKQISKVALFFLFTAVGLAAFWLVWSL